MDTLAHTQGTQQTEPEDIHALDEIQKNYPRDVGMCCTKMLQLWLERQPDASWEQLLQALKEVEMNDLASSIEQELLSVIRGKNRPTIKLLNKLVKKSVTTKWHDLGIELLGDESLQALDEIQKNNPRDVSMCCTKMFQLWLERQPDASWRQLIQALREPNIELNELANTIEQKLISINESLMLETAPHNPLPYQQPAIPQQLNTFPQQHLSTALTFTQDEPIDNAFTKLSASVTTLIQNANFPLLQRACIEKAKSPRMLHKSNEIVPVIKEAQSFQALCLMLADSSYWNFLDIRMMEAMATASMIPAAQETIENFKKTFFSMSLKDAAPYFPIMPAKSNYTVMHEELDRDPSQMTIGELNKHRFYLETKVIQDGPDTCTIRKIMIGSVVIVWQIHINHTYQVYSRLKRLHSQLSLQAIRHISVPVMKRWEGLPLLFPGQDMGEVGPIESSPDVRHEPYPLPQRFEWCMNVSDIIQDLSSMSKELVKLLLQPKMRYLLGIRLPSSSNNKLVFLLTCIPYNIRVGRKLLSTVYLQETVQRHPDIEEEQLFQLCNTGSKEAMKILGSEGIFQALIFFNRKVTPKPIITFDVYFWDSHFHSLPYTTPRTVGLRRMKQSDVSKALALTNQYTSQFEIAQVFQSEEEFSHWFLDPLVDNMTTYVVEETSSGNITDMFSFKTYKYTSENITEVVAMVITSSSAKEIITDLVVCTQQENATIVILPRFGLKEDLFIDFLQGHSLSATELCIQNHGCYLFYNYKYPEVDDENHCLFGPRLRIRLTGGHSL